MECSRIGQIEHQPVFVLRVRCPAQREPFLKYFSINFAVTNLAIPFKILAIPLRKALKGKITQLVNHFITRINLFFSYTNFYLISSRDHRQSFVPNPRINHQPIHCFERTVVLDVSTPWAIEIFRKKLFFDMKMVLFGQEVYSSSQRMLIFDIKMVVFDRKLYFSSQK